MALLFFSFWSTQERRQLWSDSGPIRRSAQALRRALYRRLEVRLSAANRGRSLGVQALAKVAQEEFAKERSVEETAMAELLPMFVEKYLVPNEGRILAPRTEPKEPKKAPAKKR